MRNLFGEIAVPDDDIFAVVSENGVFPQIDILFTSVDTEIDQTDIFCV